LCSEGLVDAQRLRRGQLRDDDYPKLARAAGLLGTAPIWIDDSASLTPLAMRSKARRLKAEHDIALVIVDYLQLMQGPGDVENRQQEISYISRSLKALAKELDVPVVAISQLSRAPEQRGGEHPRRRMSARRVWGVDLTDRGGRRPDGRTAGRPERCGLGCVSRSTLRDAIDEHVALEDRPCRVRLRPGRRHCPGLRRARRR